MAAMFSVLEDEVDLLKGDVRGVDPLDFFPLFYYSEFSIREY